MTWKCEECNKYQADKEEGDTGTWTKRISCRYCSAPRLKSKGVNKMNKEERLESDRASWDADCERERKAVNEE